MQKKKYPGTNCVFVHVYVYIKKENPTELLNTNKTGKKCFSSSCCIFHNPVTKNVFTPTSDFLLLLFNQNKVKGDEKIEEEMVSYFQK